MIDQESSIMKATRDAEIDLVDINARAYREKGVRVEVAPVSGHNYSGLVFTHFCFLIFHDNVFVSMF